MPLITLLLIALASPIDEVADRSLLAHMVRHHLMMFAAAPLFVWARPMPYLICSLPRALRKAVGSHWNNLGLSQAVRAIRRPTATLSAFCGIVLLWHVPATVYAPALDSPTPFGLRDLEDRQLAGLIM